MKKFKVTLMVPKVSVIDASSIQDAHNQVHKMLHQGVRTTNEPHPIMHSIEELSEKKITLETA